MASLQDNRKKGSKLPWNYTESTLEVVGLLIYSLLAMFFSQNVVNWKLLIGIPRQNVIGFLRDLCLSRTVPELKLISNDLYNDLLLRKMTGSREAMSQHHVLCSFAMFPLHFSISEGVTYRIESHNYETSE